MRSEVFWTDQYSPRDEINVSSTLPDKVDVVIVGSGYPGLSAARILARSDISVAVLERHSIGWGASSRNGGMATPGLKQDIYKVYKKYGMEYAREFWKASVEAIDLLEDIIEEHNIDCDWSRKGHIALACKQSHYEKLPEYADWIQRELGHTKTIVPKKEIKTEIGTEFYFGGLSDEVSGGLQPAKYLYGEFKGVISG